MSKARANQAARVPRIALTGGIASGKSTVAKLFAALGAQLIDTDQIARDVVAPPSPVLDRIATRFGPDILLANGSLDRAKLRRLVFADPKARADLEAITHPAIHATVERLTRQPAGPYQLIAIPLLVETGTQAQYDRVLLVDASPETQRRRLMLRDGVDAAGAAALLAAQASRDTRRAAAHDIIDHEGDVGHLAAQVEALHRRYQALRSQPGDS
jgi:dephospho-CoA kinase